MILNTEAMSSDEKLNAGTNLLESWYAAEIRELAEDYRKRIAAGEFDDVDALWENVDETTDGHEFVVYTYRAKCVCLVSDSSDAYESDIGEKPDTVEAQACYAMRADLHEALHDAEELFEAREAAEAEKAG